MTVVLTLLRSENSSKFGTFMLIWNLTFELSVVPVGVVSTPGHGPPRGAEIQDADRRVLPEVAPLQLRGP